MAIAVSSDRLVLRLALRVASLKRGILVTGLDMAKGLRGIEPARSDRRIEGSQAG